MNIHHLLYVCLLSELTDGNSTGLSENALIHVEGESAVVACHFSLSGRKTFLCRDECAPEDVLVETQGDSAQSGRYSITYVGGTFPLSSTIVYVGIAELTKSDSGWYKCGLERPYMPDSYHTFEIRVTDAKDEFPEQTEGAAAAAVHRHKDSHPAYGLPLAVCVSVLLAAVVLIFYKWNTRMDSNGLTTRGRSQDRNTEFAVCEECHPESKPADSRGPATRTTCSEEDKIYCNL